MRTPSSLQELAELFDRLPGVGPRAALRYAYWAASQPKGTLRRFADTFGRLAEQIVPCPICGAWTDTAPCSICTDLRREVGELCVVAESQDIRVIEHANVFRGRYHVLGGLIDPIEGKTPETLRIQTLLDRIRRSDGTITELVLALNPDVLGDATALYLTRQMQFLPIKISRLARGIPTGAQIEYADESTLADAFLNRTTQKNKE